MDGFELEWDRIQYDVKDKQVLYEQSGRVKNGQLLALLGKWIAYNESLISAACRTKWCR